MRGGEGKQGSSRSDATTKVLAISFRSGLSVNFFRDQQEPPIQNVVRFEDERVLYVMAKIGAQGFNAPPLARHLAWRPPSGAPLFGHFQAQVGGYPRPSPISTLAPVWPLLPELPQACQTLDALSNECQRCRECSAVAENSSDEVEIAPLAKKYNWTFRSSAQPGLTCPAPFCSSLEHGSSLNTTAKRGGTRNDRPCLGGASSRNPLFLDCRDGLACNNGGAPLCGQCTLPIPLSHRIEKTRSATR